MKRTVMLKRGAAAAIAALLAAGCMAIPASAAALERDPPKGYATALPSKSDAGVLTWQDFETDKINDEGFVGKFTATTPDDPNISPATIEIVSGVSKSGSKSLKVSKRGVNSSGSPQGYNTLTYASISLDIDAKFVKDANNRNKTDTYFISAWVRNVDPNVTQKFWLQLQYGGSGEVWLPGQTYYEVKGDTWTQIGIAVVDGTAYYAPFTEDSTKSGIYASRSGMTSWSALKFITKEPKKDPSNENETMVQTNDDFYVDDIVIWKVEDASKLVATLPTASTAPVTPGTTTAAPTSPGGGTTAAPVTEPGSSESDTDPTESSEAVDTTSEDGATTTAAAAQTGTDTTAGSTAAVGGGKGGLSGGAIAGIVIGVVAILGAGGFCLYWFVLRKKPEVPGGPEG